MNSETLFVMNNKVIIIDMGEQTHRTYFASLANPGMSKKYTCMSMILGNLKRIGVNEGDLIICACEGLNNWRKSHSVEYKSDRKPIPQSFWDEMNELMDDIEAGTNWAVIKVPTCLSGDTRIDTPIGTANIKKIIPGQKVNSFNMKTQKIEVSNVLNVQQSKSYHRYNIYFDGVKLPLKTTEEHPIYTLSGWLMAKDLNVGDIVYHSYDAKLNNANIQRELGYFNGYLMGDGYCNYKKNCVAFESIDLDAIKNLRRLSRKLFNIKCKIHKNTKLNKNHNDTYSIVLYGRERIYSILYSDKYKENDLYKKGFVAGFFDAEGTHNKKRHIIRIVNTDKTMIDYVFNTLTEFNFNPKKYLFEDKRTNRKDIWAVDLNGLDKTAKFFQKFYTSIERKKINTVSNGLRISRIEYVRCERPYKNYNLEVYPNNNYFANGVLVHNCEADDVMAVSCRYFHDREVVLCTQDHDLHQMWIYPNVKIYSPHPKSKKYKIRPDNYNVYKDIAKSVQKEAGDGLKSEIMTAEERENREMLVSFITLPSFVEEPIKKALDEIDYNKDIILDLLPGKKIPETFMDIYKKDKVITYEQQRIIDEKKEARKKAKKEKENLAKKKLKQKEKENVSKI